MGKYSHNSIPPTPPLSHLVLATALAVTGKDFCYHYVGEKINSAKLNGGVKI
jgi:hypothetical protein